MYGWHLRSALPHAAVQIVLTWCRTWYRLCGGAAAKSCSGPVRHKHGHHIYDLLDIRSFGQMNTVVSNAVVQMTLEDLVEPSLHRSTSPRDGGCVTCLTLRYLLEVTIVPRQLRI